MTQYREVDDNELMTLYGARPSAPQSQQPQLAQTQQPAQFVQNQLAPVAPPVQRTAPVAQAPVAQAPALSDQAPAPDMNRMAQSVLRTQQQMQQRPAAEAQNPVREAIDYITDNWEMFAVPSAAVAANYAVKNLSPSKRSIVDRMFNLNAPQTTVNSPMAVDRVDPVMDTMNPVQKMDIDVKRLDPEWQKIIAQSEANRVSKERELEQRRQQRQQAAVDRINQVPEAIGNPTPKSPNPIPDVVASTMPAQPAIQVPTVADIGKQALGVAPVAPPATIEQVAAQVAPPVQPTEAPAQTAETKKKGRPTKEAQAKAMEGLTFRPDLGPGDNWLFNSFGAEGRKAILAQYNEGKPAGSYENAQQIFKRMQEERVTPGRAELPRDIAKERGVPPPETNYGKLGKTAKMAGVAGLALTAQQAAQAKNQNQLMQTIGEILLPLGATPSELAPGTLTQQQLRAFQEAQKLGSPYRSVPPPQ